MTTYDQCAAALVFYQPSQAALCTTLLDCLADRRVPAPQLVHSSYGVRLDWPHAQLFCWEEVALIAVPHRRYAWIGQLREPEAVPLDELARQVEHALHVAQQ